jgi:hypothetical protein
MSISPPNKLTTKIISSTIACTLLFQNNVIAAPPKIPTYLNLETAIINVEQATDRATLVQSFADLFESAGQKTLLARSKYKYVSYFLLSYQLLCLLVICHLSYSKIIVTY